MLRFLSRFRNSFTLLFRDTSASAPVPLSSASADSPLGTRPATTSCRAKKYPIPMTIRGRNGRKPRPGGIPSAPCPSLRCIRAQGSECGTETSFLPPNRREAPRNGTGNLAGQYPAGSISATVRQAPPPLLQGNRAPRYSFLSPNRSTSPRSMRRNIVASSATTGEIRPITSSM